VAGACASVIALREARLGDINLDCPKGMLVPEKRGASEKHSVLSLGISKYADRIYVICTDECDMTIPEEMGDKVMLLNGFELDVCNGLTSGYSHWIKASQSHLHAVTHAISVGAETILILEQDSMADGDVAWTDGNWQEFNQALETKPWNMVRLGYRPLTFEYDPLIEKCPEQCVCENVGEVLCWLASPGCDLRASDAYLLHARGFQEYATALRGGGIIDNGVLQRLGNQLVVTPQVHYQTKATTDFTSVEHQKDVAALFSERCHMGLTRTEAAAAAAAAMGEALGDAGEEEDDSEDDVSESPNLGRARLEQRGLVSFESLARSKEFVTENGERVAAASAIEVFGGLRAFLERRQRLGR
jgi:hypothetical protein